MWRYKLIWLLVAAAVGGGVFLLMVAESDVELPEAREAADFEVALEPVGEPEEVLSGAEQVNLAVPFAPQAPHANWDQPYQDACEEAAVIMVERYLDGRSLNLDEMDEEILKMVDFQNSHYGFFKDSNIAETVRLTEAYFPHLAAEAYYDISVDDIRAKVAAGKAVIVLADGRLLGNPHYTGEGPDKHALVIKGFVGDKLVTNDPGTRHGEDFVYMASTVMDAIVDYDGDTPGTGKKAMIVISSS